MDWSNYVNISKDILGTGGTLAANEATQSAYREILKNLKDRFGEYDSLSPADYQAIAAQQLGPSAMAGIAPDAKSRVDQQEAISQLDQIAKSGGLTLEDKQALNKLEERLSRGAGARNASLANQFAARGQLGSGQQLAMSLAANQEATSAANERGEDIAAQAQKRAMEAVLSKGAASRAMSNDDYARQRAAAEAADAIAKYNASMRTDASKYNNTIKGQTFDDQLRRLSGKNQVTRDTNNAVLGSGKQQANTIAGVTYGAQDLLGNLFKGGSKGSSGGGGSTGGGTDPSTTGDTSGDTPTSGMYDEPLGPTQESSEPSASGDWPQLSDDEGIA